MGLVIHRYDVNPEVQRRSVAREKEQMAADFERGRAVLEAGGRGGRSDDPAEERIKEMAAAAAKRKAEAKAKRDAAAAGAVATALSAQ